MESSDGGSVDGDHMNEDVESIASPDENETAESQERSSDVQSNCASAPQSPSSPQQASSPIQSPLLSPPQSPLSPARSEDRSEDEVHVSEAEQSDNEGGDRHSINDDISEKNVEHDDEPSSDRENNAGKHSDSEESEAEENVPEINIESGDEENERDNNSRNSGCIENSSDIEAETQGRSDDEKEESDHDMDKNEIPSDAENADSGDEKASVDNEQQNSISSPMTETHADEEKENKMSDDEEEVPTKEKATSDNEEADSDNEANSDSDAESEVGGLIADIFGQSDDDEEFEGFNEEDIASTQGKEKKKRSAKVMSDSEEEEADEPNEVIEDVPAPPPEEKVSKKAQVVSDDSDDDNRKMREDFVSDFDLMMQKKKEEGSKRRRRRDVDIINDSDDLIADIIAQMRQAADEDRVLNKEKRTATKKLKILPMVLSQVKKQDLKSAFLDQGVLNVMADWLAPLPDKSLPHLNIREGMIKQLADFLPIDHSLLKSSGVGRALMYLFKHPKETKENRERAGKLIKEWARPIFNVTTDYHSLTKEEREQRDYDHLPKRRRKDVPDDEEERKDISKEMTEEQKSLRPGDKGWVGRARVPMPSTRDYVNRPKWNVEMEFGRGSAKKPLNRIEKHMRMLQEKKRLSKGQRAITISIEGRKMAI